MCFIFIEVFFFIRLVCAIVSGCIFVLIVYPGFVCVPHGPLKKLPLGPCHLPAGFSLQGSVSIYPDDFTVNVNLLQRVLFFS